MSPKRACDEYDPMLTYTNDNVVLFSHPPLPFSKWSPSPFTMDLVEYNCVEQFMMVAKTCLFGGDMVLLDTLFVLVR